MPANSCKNNFSLYRTSIKSSAKPVSVIKNTLNNTYKGKESSLVATAKAEAIQTVKNTDRPPDRVAG
jgi:hypothetical protein